MKHDEKQNKQKERVKERPVDLDGILRRRLCVSLLTMVSVLSRRRRNEEATLTNSNRSEASISSHLSIRLYAFSVCLVQVI